ncbi:MAG: tyrosine-type recombinase/integrase [Chloroflexi bacterium]|nr:tyrosine-type recombinase/integrase [Chloroflexota bacterium]
MLPEIESFRNWLRRRAPQSSTARHYGNDLELFFAWLGKPCHDVKVQDVDTFIEHSQAQGYALTTINRRLATLRSFYHFLAIQFEDAPRNPVIPYRHCIRHGLRLPRDVQDETLAKLFGVMDNPRDRAMFLLMLRCGLRVGEVRNLSLCDLYLEPSFGSLPRLWLNGKGGGQRVVYLSSQPLAALQTWLSIRPIVDDDAVFLNRFGRRLTITGIQDRLARYCRKAGLWVTCHQFRHTFGRHLTEARVPVTTLQRLLGHTRLRSTEVYLHISNAQVQEDYDTAMQEIIRTLSLQEGGRP